MHLVIRSKKKKKKKALPRTVLSHSRFSVPLNAWILTPYPWLAASLGQRPPVFLQLPAQDLLMLHVAARRTPPFRPSSMVRALWGLKAGMAGWISLYMENHPSFTGCSDLLPVAMALLVTSPPLFKSPTVLVEPNVLVSAEMVWFGRD